MRRGLAGRLALALAVLFAAGQGDAAPKATGAARNPRAPARRGTRVLAAAARPPPRAAVAPPGPWARALAPIKVRNRNRGARADVRLYADDGGLNRAGLDAFMRVAGADADELEPLEPRLVQLAVRAAYHFGGKPIVVVSATRKGAHGKHGTGDALDFQLEGVRAGTLAAWLRATPRAGVGIYTHPKTQYVHLDVREESFHWLDGSPPGVTWRERRLPNPKRAARDAAYVRALNLPEVALR